MYHSMLHNGNECILNTKAKIRNCPERKVSTIFGLSGAKFFKKVLPFFVEGLFLNTFKNSYTNV